MPALKPLSARLVLRRGSKLRRKARILRKVSSVLSSDILEALSDAYVDQLERAIGPELGDLLAGLEMDLTLENIAASLVEMSMYLDALAVSADLVGAGASPSEAVAAFHAWEVSSRSMTMQPDA